MMTRYLKVTALFLPAFLLLSFSFALERLPGVWANWRGPMQNGTSDEKGLPASWSPQGENLLWKVPVGGRSSPVVMGDRVFLINTAGQGALEQEQLVCLDANTGKVLWQHRFNIFNSDVPPHRVGWASPVADPVTERVYAMGVGGTFLCLDKNGKLLWERSLAEEFGMITTHGGRTVTPVLYGNLVITSGIMASWGAHTRNGHRYLAFDKMTGDVVWFAQPGERPYDTCYPTALITDIGGRKLLIDGGGDGGVHAMKLFTGEHVWSFELSKRGLHSAIVTDGNRVFAAHGQENLDTNVMGRVVAIDPKGSGNISKTGEVWRADGLIVEFPSAALHRNRLYYADNSANLICLDKETGRELWRQSLGTLQRASPVYADGKIYIGTENGKFYILQPGESECRILDVEELHPQAGEEEILATVAIANGRIFLVSTKNTYCIGSKSLPPIPAGSPRPAAPRPAPSTKPAAWVQVVPTELILPPGQEVRFEARSFDEDGYLVRTEKATWSLSGIQGSLGADGRFSSDRAPQAGMVQATVGALKGAARIRVLPSPPWTEDFEAYAPGGVPPHWVGAGGKFEIREVEGSKVLVKLSNEASLLRRTRTYMGPSELSDYTMEADAFGIERRRQMPDIGIIAQRYALVLLGNAQKLVIESWQPEVERTVTVPLEWKPSVWYRMKLRVENHPGKAIARGKAWPKGEPEPAEWQIVKEDPIPNLNGAPGLFAYAHNEIYYDNIKITGNSK